MCVLVEIVGNSERGGDGIIKGMRKLPCWNFGVGLTIMLWMQEDYDVDYFVG